jgi:mRNA-degrading endonuclease RelE of RelBE toxin-antitoxin system
LNYTLRISNSFERQLRRLSKADRERVWKLLHEIEQSPYSYKYLGGQLTGTHSARIGDLRVIFAIDERRKRVLLLYVGPRERVYER